MDLVLAQGFGRQLPAPGRVLVSGFRANVGLAAGQAGFHGVTSLSLFGGSGADVSEVADP